MTAKSLLDDYVSKKITLAELIDEFRVLDWDGPTVVEHDDIPAPSDNSWDIVDIDPRIGPNVYQRLAQAYASAQSKG